MTATVHRLPVSPDVTLDAAARAYLATLAHPETEATRRAYGTAYRLMTAALGGSTPLSGLSPSALADWFAGQWGNASPATWTARRGALRSLLGYCEDHGWIPSAAVLMSGIGTRKARPDRDRALSRDQVEALLADDRHSLRDRLLWRMAYETAARSSELLGLDVTDLDMANRRARIRRKGGAMDVIVWQTATARLLPRYLKGRAAGPLFVTNRRARVELAPCDLDSRGRARLGYRQAEDIFKAASGGYTLHQLRHSALTHAAEDGTSTPMLMARSGHTSVRSLARYARVSAEALQRHQEQTDPARRRRA